MSVHASHRYIVCSSDLSRSERGAAMLEFALIAFLFFALIVTFLDFARIFTAQALLTRGAQQGATLATKVAGFANDIARLDPLAPDFAEQYAAYQAARQDIIAQTSMLSATLVSLGASTAPNASIRILPYTAIDQVGGAIQEQPPALALVLRPGDGGMSSADNYVHHLRRCSELIPGCPAGFRRGPADSMESMLQRFPIVVNIRAEVRTYSPFIDNMVVTGLAMAYREQPVASGEQHGMVAPNEIDTRVVIHPNDPGDYDCDLEPSDCAVDQALDRITCACYSHTCSLTEDDCPPGRFIPEWCMCDSGLSG